MDKELEHLRLLQKLIETRIRDLENNRVAGYAHEHRWYDAVVSDSMISEFKKQGIVLIPKSQQATLKYGINYLDYRLLAEIVLIILPKAP